VRHFQLVAQLFRTNAILGISELSLVEIADEDGLQGQALEIERSVIEGEREVDMAQVIVEEDPPHCLYLRECLGILSEDCLQVSRHLE
jgi:hypothetical protein